MPTRTARLLAALVPMLALAAASAASAARPHDPEAAGRRLPVPDEAARARAEKLVRDLFKKDYARKDAADLRALAAKLLQQGVETKDDPAARYVLFREARDLALQGGALDAAFRAIDELARSFAVDGLELRLAALTAAAKEAKTPEAAKAVFDHAWAVLDEALATDNYDAAQRLLPLADVAARRTKNVPLVTRIEARAAEVRELKGEAGQAAAAAEALKNRPADAEAHLVVGRYLGLGKGDWERALPHLKQGPGGSLKELAARDLERPADAAARAALAEDWARLAEGESRRLARVNLLKRSHHWYRLAVAGLTGLAKTKAEARLKEIEAQLPAARETLTLPAKALRFAKADYVEVAGTKGLIDLNGTFTAELWVRWKPSVAESHALMGDDLSPLLSPQVKSEAGWALATTRSQNGQRGLTLVMGTPPTSSSSSSKTARKPSWYTVEVEPRPDGEDWQHIAVCKTPTGVKVFWNGKVVASKTFRTRQFVPSGSEVYLGVRKGAEPGRQFAGEIRAFRLSSSARYTKEFTPAESFSPDAETLVLLDFSVGHGKQLTDLSGHGRHGVIVGADWVDAGELKRK